MNDELAGILGVVAFIAFVVCVFSHPSILLLFFLGYLFFNAFRK